MDLVLRPAVAGRQNVVIVFDLSDSCERVFEQLSRLVPLSKELPSNWPVALFALSSREPLRSCSDVLYASDLEHYLHSLESSPEAAGWIPAFKNRGSFIRQPLEGIANYLEAERVVSSDCPQDTLILVLTDGELLDASPAHVRDNCTLIGGLLESHSRRSSRWSDVLPGCQAFGLSTPELFSALRRCISPANQLYEIKATFPITNKDQPHRGRSSGGPSNRVIQWDFSTGNLTLTTHREVLKDQNAFIECQPREGKATRFAVHRLIKGLPANLTGFGSDADSATIKNGSFLVIENPEMVARLFEHIRYRAQDRQPWDVEYVKMLCRPELHATGGRKDSVVHEFDAAVAIFTPMTLGSEASVKRLLVGKLYRDKSKFLYLKPSSATLEDPGFTVQKLVHFSYHECEARWQMTDGEKCKNLDPHGSQCLGEHFLDRHGNACDAFYSGPIDSAVFGLDENGN